MPRPHGTRAAPPARLAGSRLVLVTASLLLSQMLSAIDTSIVATAMPRIIGDLAGLEYYAWVTTAYLVASTTVIPISGKLGDLFGRRRFLIGGIAGFLVASALCGVAQSMPQLVAARALQGVFGGFLTSSAIASIADLYSPATRARMQGVFMSVFAVAAIGGPIVGGLLTDSLGWRSVFYVNVPFGLVALAMVALTMPPVRTDATREHIDVRGALLLIGGLVPFLVALTAARQDGLTSPFVIVLATVAAVLLGAFVRTELRAAHPLMPLGLFREPTFARAVIVSFLSAFALFGSNIFVPLIYQGLLGLSATQSGILLTPRMIAMTAMSLVSGQLMSRVTRYRYVGVGGLALLTLGLYLLSTVRPGTSEADVMRDLLIIGAGFGATQPVYQNTAMSAVSRHVVGVASSLVQFWRSLGQTIGVTILGEILASQVGASLVGPEALATSGTALEIPALTSGLHLVFLAAAAIALAATVTGLLMREVPIRGRGASREPAEAVASAPA